MVFSPRSVRLSGSGISVGDFPLLFSEPHLPISLTSWHHSGCDGELIIGNAVLLTPGVRLAAAGRVQIDDDCMLASETYISDCDWHGTYDRVSSLGEIRPVHLKRNVWIGSRAIVCKGVTIGENSIVGAGAVVTSDVPANTVAAGVPARKVAELDPAAERKVRSEMFADPAGMKTAYDYLDRVGLAGNSLSGWLRSTISPTDKH